MSLGLVLGGGGLVGIGYHAGVLKALEEWGVDPLAADLVVGTSAGAVIGAYLRSGWSAGDFYDYVHGRHPIAGAATAEAQRDEVRALFTPLSQTNPERVRRLIGSTFAALTARGYWARVGGGVPSARLRRTFPSGMYSTEPTRKRLYADLPQAWPQDDLYISTVELYEGKRVAFGQKTAPEATLPDAVLASTSIPGVFPAVKIAGRRYVDGGVLSSTSLDLAVEAGCSATLCIAPLAYRREEPPSGPKAQLRPRRYRQDLRSLTPMLIRSFYGRTLKKEMALARDRGVDVLVFTPWMTELRQLGANTMRHYDRAAVADAARDGALRVLTANSDHPAVGAFLRAGESRQKVGT